MFKVAAEREAGVFEQLVLPLVRSATRRPGSEAEARLDELGRPRRAAAHAALLRQAVRGITWRR